MASGAGASLPSAEFDLGRSRGLCLGAGASASWVAVGLVGG
jgi:hypothetical protein